MADWASIGKSLAENPTDASVIGRVEKYVDLQAKDPSAYDLNAFLVLLRLYLAHPDKADLSSVVKVLLKSLTHLPQPDFHAVKYLLPSAALQSADVLAALELAQLLEACKFVEFWALSKSASLSASISGISGFGNSIRLFIMSVLQRSYQQFNVSELTGLLDLNAKDIAEFLSKNKFLVEGNLVRFPLTAHNQMLSKTITEEIPFERLQRLL
eukprot:TRINITY_DN6671_c0_g2_i1.p1 TRINITY_DN6671_c0_g2~~TRINITY_DN6671_c0_g2_i1.p1  ORF type:complete len:212 (+),score=56.93 TRINITY_DN6671_c0_g2_i1:156-791(+)